MNSSAASNAQVACVADNLGDNLVHTNSTAAPTKAEGQGVAATAATLWLEAPSSNYVNSIRGRA